MIDSEANKRIAEGVARIAVVQASARQDAAVKPEVREVQTTVIRDRIVERAAKRGQRVDSTLNNAR